MLLLTVLHAASALPAAGRAEEQERDSELDRLVNRIRTRVIDELGLSHTVVRVSTFSGVMGDGCWGLECLLFVYLSSII